MRRTLLERNPVLSLRSETGFLVVSDEGERASSSPVRECYNGLAGGKMTRAAVPPEELACLPYVGNFDPGSAESEVMRKLPQTLIICACKGETHSR